MHLGGNKEDLAPWRLATMMAAFRLTARRADYQKRTGPVST